MQTQHTADQASTPELPDSTFATLTAVPQRKDDVEERIVEYVQNHPHSTIGDIAKGLNVDRGTIAAGRSHIVRADDVNRG